MTTGEQWTYIEDAKVEDDSDSYFFLLPLTTRAVVYEYLISVAGTDNDLITSGNIGVARLLLT